jgi:hypothetical protein
MKKKIGLSIIVLAVLIQFIRPSKNTGEAEGKNDLSHSVTIPDTIRTILKVACYDCHSDHTDYRWYHEIMPVGWWLSAHVEDGKKHLNFSQFRLYNDKKKDHKLEEIAEEVEHGEMPLGSYTWLHKDAKLSEEQIKMLKAWVEQQRQEIKSKTK